MHHMYSGKCRCPHHLVLGLVIFIFGVLFLLQATGTLSSAFVSYAWPVLVILVGAYKLIEGVCRCCWGKAQMKDSGCGEPGGCGEGKCGCGTGEEHSHK